MKILEFPKLHQLPAIGYTTLEYGPGGDNGYLLAWEGSAAHLGHLLVAILRQDARTDDLPDAGSPVTNRARLHTLLRWLATFTAPDTATPRLATFTAEEAAALPYPGIEGWGWHRCALEVFAPTIGASALLVFVAAPIQQQPDAAYLIRQARGVAKLGLMLEASQQ